MRRDKLRVMIAIIIVFVFLLIIINTMIISKVHREEGIREVNETNEGIQGEIAEEPKNSTELEDGTKLNISEKVNSKKNIDGLKIENINLMSKDGGTMLTADVTNNTGRDLGITTMDLILKDESGEEIVKMGGILSPVKKGEKVQLNHAMTLDYSNVYDLEIRITK